MKRYDIIISGGGMIGSVSAVAASQLGFSVLLIEAQKSPKITLESPRDLRVSAISEANISALKKWRIFDYLIGQRIQSYSKMHVWDNRGSGEIKFKADEAWQSSLGYLMENNNLIQAARLALKSENHCDVMEQCRILHCENEGSQIRIELSDGQRFKSRLLLAAEGRQSSLRKQSGIEVKEKSYQQKGLVAYVKLPQAPDNTALQAFNDGGPVGILPINNDDKLFSIVWSLPEKQAQNFLECSPKEFQQALMWAIGKNFGEVELLSQRAAFPLSQLSAQRYFHKRLVLCGDSAHGVHPLAGQGVNLGLGDIQLLFQLLDAKKLRDDDYLTLALRKYQRQRLSKVQETSQMMSFLHHLFKDDALMKKPLRNIGLKLLNNSPLKKWLMQQAGS